jgi:hypothetical protein
VLVALEEEEEEEDAGSMTRTVRPLFAIDRFLDTDRSFLLYVWSGWETSGVIALGNSAASILDFSGLLVKLYTSIDTCFNDMFLAKLLSKGTIQSKRCAAACMRH